MTAGKQQDSNQSEGGPDIAVLDHGHDVRPGDVDGSQATGNHGEAHSPLEVVDRSLDGRMRAAIKVADKPGVHHFGGNGSIGEVIADWLGASSSVGTGSGREEEEDGSSLEAELLQVVSFSVSLRVNLATYTHEGLSAFTEIQRTKNNTRLARLVALDPALGEKLPLRLEFAAELAAVAGIESCQDNGDAIIARGGSERLEGGIVELDGGVGCLFGVELCESLLGGLLSSKRSGREQRRRQEGGQPAHLVELCILTRAKECCRGQL